MTINARHTESERVRNMLLKSVCALLAVTAAGNVVLADPWPQFRGLNACGISQEHVALPSSIGPKQNVVWQIEIPPGASSPVIFNDRVYLTGLREPATLVTFAVRVRDGSVVWERPAPLHKLEQTDKRPRGRLATATCATDGERVVSFFGSSGLLCYDIDGKLLWHREMGPFNNRRGAVSSPVIVGDLVLLLQDHAGGSFIAAFDLTTGNTVWKSDRALFARSYGTPVVLSEGARRSVVAVGSGLITAYGLKTGRVNWFTQGSSSVANITPVANRNGILYVASANPGVKREGQLTFAQIVERDDANDDETLEKNEIRAGFLRDLFDQIDADGDGRLGSAEYDAAQSLMRTSRNGLMALRLPGDDAKGASNRTNSAELWHVRKGIPRTASPILFEGHLYMASKGGVFHTLNAETSATVRLGRIEGRGNVFGSPVLGDGKVFVISDRGECSVVTARPDWELLSSSEFNEPVYATPAISDGRVYVRTETRLYSFGLGE